jgi:hypothetical protein
MGRRVRPAVYRAGAGRAHVPTHPPASSHQEGRSVTANEALITGIIGIGVSVTLDDLQDIYNEMTGIADSIHYLTINMQALLARQEKTALEIHSIQLSLGLLHQRLRAETEGTCDHGK